MRKKTESKHGRDTRYRLQGWTKFIQYNEFLKSRECAYPRIHTVPSSLHSSRKYFILFIFPCPIIFGLEKEKSTLFFFHMITSMFIYFLLKVLNPHILPPLTSGNIILTFLGKQRAPGQTRT